MLSGWISETGEMYNEVDFSDDAEITLETNLHDLSEDYIKLVSASRINRLSIGVQSFTEKFLKMMLKML